jgi:hypothetical protein
MAVNPKLMKVGGNEGSINVINTLTTRGTTWMGSRGGPCRRCGNIAEDLGFVRIWKGIPDIFCSSVNVKPSKLHVFQLITMVLI